MYDTITSCPVCGGGEFSEFLKGKDHFLTGEFFAILECRQCRFKMTSPVPPSSEMGKFYESVEYISHDAAGKTLMNRIYKTARRFTLGSKSRIVKRYSKGKNILDIGCGTGEFLVHMRRLGFVCSGIEPNPKARKFAREVHQLPVEGEIKMVDDRKGSVDCITLWHVLEHIQDLHEIFSFINHLLKPDGILILALPNPESWDAGFYKEYWAAYDLPRHLYHFSSGHVEQLAGSHGFDLQKILPQYLDSFYISLLSEKYKSGKNNPLRAFMNGCRSNLAACRKGNGYSGQIYVLSRDFR